MLLLKNCDNTKSTSSPSKHVFNKKFIFLKNFCDHCTNNYRNI